MRIPLPPMFLHYYSTFLDNDELFGYPLLKTAKTEFMNMFFVSVIQGAEYGTADLFLPARLRALSEDGSTRANEEALPPLPCKMRDGIVKRGLLRIISDCTVDLVPAILAIAHAGEIDGPHPTVWTGACLTLQMRLSSLYLNGRQKNVKHGLRGDALSAVVHAKVERRYADESRDAGMSRDFAKTVWMCYMADVLTCGTSRPWWNLVSCCVIWTVRTRVTWRRGWMTRNTTRI